MAAGGRPLVWVLVPFVETSDPNLAYYNDYTQSRAEYERAFASLDMSWRWQPVSMDNFRTVLDEIAADEAHAPVVFNLCDGDETNGVPGLSVVRHLDDLGLCYTGADANFFDLTTSKITMKQRFDESAVPTAPWAIVGSDTSVGDAFAADAFARCGSPLIVKPAVSAGSMGITIKSVVSSDAELREQLAILRDGYRGWDLTGGGVLAERFINGPEFTSFIIGAANDPSSRLIYPAVERVFNATLPATERFLSFDRLWEIYERETPLANEAYLWEYAAAPAALQTRIAELSWAAYAAVGGRGYGRVDLRLDAASSELYVLEVNAQCGLSEDENYTSIGAILRLANVPFHAMVQRIIDEARRAYDTRRSADDTLQERSS
jgi:D-alanine-D-alanine ligase